MFKNPRVYIWIITGLVAVILLVFTVNLRSRASSQESAGFAGTISGVNSAIYLYEQPRAGSHIITLLDLGEMVYVAESEMVGETLWHYVNTESASGWVRANRVSRDPP